MTTVRYRWAIHLTLGLALGCICLAADAAADEAKFQVGYAERDVTPQKPMPMWGYAARHAALSNGILDPLMAKAVVIVAGDQKLALVGTDLGRGPTIAMMEKIRKEIKEKAGVDHVLITGSHSHHGPVLELTDQPGKGKGKFDDAVAYSLQYPNTLIEMIVEAANNAKPAKMGIGKKNVGLNRNRHTKRQPPATEPMLAVLRFDDEAGKPIAVIVNFAAHPTMIDAMILKYSAEYPGHMQRKVEEKLGAHCVFMQGAAGDMSANPPAGVSGPQEFGEALADEVLSIISGIETKTPAKPGVRGKVDRVLFDSRVDFTNPFVGAAFSKAFFPELVPNFLDELKNGIPTELNTVLLNGEIGLVGGSGEFFSNHSNRLKERSYLPHTLFFGYCNGHNLYFPTIEAASEGGYGADPQMSPVALGAGEELMNLALKNLYSMQGRLAVEPALKAKPPATPDAKTPQPAAAGN
ncbi:MAG: neutral/alkaline non-lysosomal ceramidase N-terminal domain-containing protein [Planctomycetaceae bacterium]|nr:neutral/alkaline non-lysosomal ceramidase N-terminal domain-containing protein [Planctomycetaceae bacterium]